MSIMGLRVFFIFLILALSGVHGFPREPWRSEYSSISKYRSGSNHNETIYRVRIEDLRPTQFALGVGEVRERAHKLSKMDKHELRKYLKKKIGSVVIGPGEEIFLVDGHHLASAVLRIGKEEMLVKVLHDWSKLKQEEFFDRMIKEKLLWPYDEQGRRRHPRDLPRSVSLLRDDVYRTLAYRVREAGGYEDLTVPFQEFFWANYFRSRIALDFVRRKPGAALKQALELARDPSARRLPGFACPRLLSR